MARREYSHFDRDGRPYLDANGRPIARNVTRPRHLRGYDEYSTGTLREGLLSRLLNPTPKRRR
jgi:hypothetical protein